MTGRQAFRSFDVIYEPGAGLLARLYLPLAKPIGAVVDIHGGGWVSGSRVDNAVMAEALATAGILVMSPDFRKPPTEAYPASIADTHLAIRWLKSVAAAFGLPSGRVGGLGTSSGAQQLLLATLRPHDLRYSSLSPPDSFEEQDATLSFLMLCWPVADPLARYRMVVERKNGLLVDAHHAYWADEAAMAEGSPQLALAAVVPGALPPALLIQGSDDGNLPQDSATRFAEAYRSAGGTLTLSIFPDQPHAFITRAWTSEAAQVAMKAILDFVLAKLGEPGSPPAVPNLPDEHATG